MSSTIYPRQVFVEGLAGSGVISFQGYLAHGNGRREVAIHVEPETILRIAAELLAAGYTTDLIGDGKSVRRWATGHAMRHANKALRFDDAPCEHGCVPVPGTEELSAQLRRLSEKE